MTLHDLRRLCLEFVPRDALHPWVREQETRDRRNGKMREDWWHAHEIGHLCVAHPSDITREYFGLVSREHIYLTDGRLTFGPGHSEHYVMCRELAAMSVSRRLLAVVGRPDLYRTEVEQTEWDTVEWNHRGELRKILRRTGMLRVPHTTRGLRALLVEKTAHLAHDRSVVTS